MITIEGILIFGAVAMTWILIIIQIYVITETYKKTKELVKEIVEIKNQ